MFTTVNSVKEYTNVDVTLDLIKRAQAVIEVFIGKDEIDIDDVHPGIFGHQKYAKEIVQFLEVDLSYSHIIQPI